MSGSLWVVDPKQKSTFFDQLLPLPDPNLHLTLGLALPPSWVVYPRVLAHSLQSRGTRILADFFKVRHIVNAQ